MTNDATNYSRNTNLRTNLYETFMSPEHIAELETENGYHSFDITSKLYAQLKRRSLELATGNLFTLKKALGKEYWKKLSKEERRNADTAFWYLFEFFGWAVDYHSQRRNRNVYYFHPGWAECCVLPA